MHADPSRHRVLTGPLAAAALALALAVAVSGTALGTEPPSSAGPGPNAFGPVGVVSNDDSKPIPPKTTKTKTEEAPEGPAAGR